MLCGSLDGMGVWRRMDTCVCMAELLCCALGTVTKLLAILQDKILKCFFKKELTAN